MGGYLLFFQHILPISGEDSANPNLLLGKSYGTPALCKELRTFVAPFLKKQPEIFVRNGLLPWKLCRILNVSLFFGLVSSPSRKEFKFSKADIDLASYFSEKSKFDSFGPGMPTIVNLSP